MLKSGMAPFSSRKQIMFWKFHQHLALLAFHFIGLYSLFRIGTPLRYQKRIDGNSSIQCLWSFMVGSKMPMGTVSILHDSNRESFSITNALYYNKKKESLSLIELHPNNKVQAVRLMKYITHFKFN